jgi:hypothetical protein
MKVGVEEVNIISPPLQLEVLQYFYYSSKLFEKTYLKHSQIPSYRPKKALHFHPEFLRQFLHSFQGYVETFLNTQYTFDLIIKIFVIGLESFDPEFINH